MVSTILFQQELKRSIITSVLLKQFYLMLTITSMLTIQTKEVITSILLNITIL